MDDLDARISRGEEALDAWDTLREKRRLWFERAAQGELHTFNMAYDGACLLTILFKKYSRGLRRLKIAHGEASLYGFATARPSEYPLLTARWEERIYGRIKEKIELFIKPLGCEVTGFSPFTVGQHGDNRVYQRGVYVRFPAGMPMERRGEISTRITNQVKGVTRVFIEIDT
jgi:hypothetical protein